MSQQSTTNILSIVPKIKAKEAAESNTLETEAYLVFQVKIKSPHKDVAALVNSLDPKTNHSLYDFIDTHSTDDFLVNMYQNPLMLK